MKVYQTKDLLKLKEQWKKIAAGEIVEESLNLRQANKYMTRAMAETITDPHQERAPYMQSLLRFGVKYSTAQRIVGNAFAIAIERQKQRNAGSTAGEGQKEGRLSATDEINS